MNAIGIDQLEPNRFYWARRMSAEGTPMSEPNDIEVVQVSTVFGTTAEFWTVAVMGSAAAAADAKAIVRELATASVRVKVLM